jgi:hypothetical protein
MSEPFKLTVPADPRYRALGAEVAGKYVEVAGGSEADATALAGALSEAMTDVVDGAANGADVELAFQPTSEGLEVQLACGARTSVFRHRLPVRKH